MKPQDFIAQVAPGAQAAMAKTRVPASVSIAQAALESGWGEHAPGNNLFGIKADPSWHGGVSIKRTHEVVKGKTITITAAFRAYPDWAASITDHATFLSTNPRYRPAFAHADDGDDFAWQLQACGYATDPDYGKKLAALIDYHDLLTFDDLENLSKEKS